MIQLLPGKEKAIQNKSVIKKIQDKNLGKYLGQGRRIMGHWM